MSRVDWDDDTVADFGNDPDIVGLTSYQLWKGYDLAIWPLSRMREIEEAYYRRDGKYRD